jgi:hypothetical protein
MTWVPGEDLIIAGRVVSQGGWRPHPGLRVFNLFMGPNVDKRGNPKKAGRWLDIKQEAYKRDYWTSLYRGYEKKGGAAHVAADLREYDISEFNPKAPPPKTAAFLEIVNANRSPEDAEFADVPDRLHNPDSVTVQMVVDAATGAAVTRIDVVRPHSARNRRASAARCGQEPFAEDGPVPTAENPPCRVPQGWEQH